LTLMTNYTKLFVGLWDTKQLLNTFAIE
jgi:hypothetical protein